MVYSIHRKAPSTITNAHVKHIAKRMRWEGKLHDLKDALRNPNKMFDMTPQQWAIGKEQMEKLGYDTSTIFITKK